ncbi:S-layer homology domain-containing protein [Ructibacterium gallinarum]|uniref:S-layer homology domain-containing protein n=1 Tax=Ructibacterium gallinarum TaxID=2779355 RepID=A0A9D5M044_9FIRM|nr:S-layer homology domain-containing protein [Ructibacterium gallinarum]MBE5040192.1 S-layer homology domain-containing protein [Ructibacterium gallinarum]
MKKAGIWILIWSIWMSAMPVFGTAGALSDVTGTAYEPAVAELVSLNIMEGYEDGTFRPDTGLNRAEFAALIVRILGMEQGAESLAQQTVFQDVAAEYWAAGYIHLAAGMGIINGYGDGSFGPEDAVTLEQACKMVLECMGYGILAAEKGGYPNGYLVTAAQYGLTRGIESTGEEPLSRGDAAVLLVQSLDVDVIEKEYGTDTYSKKAGVTLRTKLCDQLNLEKKEGIVTANAYTGLGESLGMEERRIVIDGENYRTGQENLDGLLGYQVEYYAKDNADGTKSLYSIQPSEKQNRTVSFLPEDIESIEEDAFSVYQEGRSKTQKYTLAEAVQTVYNGKYLPEAGTEDWKIQNGTIRLLDNNGDGRYEIVFVEEIQTLLAGSIDAEKGLIQLKTFSANTTSQFNGKTYIDCQSTDPLVRICDADGNAVAIEDLGAMQMIGVRQSKDQELVTVIAGSAPFDGTVDAVYETEGQVSIDGEIYDLARNEQGAFLLELQPGDQGRFWPDVMGRIAAKNISTSSAGYGAEIETVNQDRLCSYLLAASQEAGFTPLVQFKLLTNLKDGSREERIFQLADSVTLNGEKMDAAEVLAAIADKNNGDYHVPMTYELNGKGKIKSLWLYTQTVPMGYMTYQSANSSFDGLYYRDADSITYFVDVRDYETVYADTAVSLNNGYRYQVRIFDPVEEEFSIQKRIFIVYVDLENAQGTAMDENQPLLVSSIVKYAQEDGTLAYMLEGFCGGQQVELSIAESAEEKAAQLRTGSLIRFSKNAVEKVTAIKILGALPPEEYFRQGVGGSNEQVYGSAVQAERNADHSSCVLTLAYLQNGAEKQASYEIAGAPVYTYDGTDVRLAETGEVGAGEKIFLQVSNFDVEAVIIIR